MNATYSLDHLQAISQVAGTLAQAGSTTAGNGPKSATTTHYDATGQIVATQSSTSFAGLSFGSGGTITGGNLSHEVSLPDGTKLTTTALGFGSDGKPGSAQIIEHNSSGSGDFKSIQMDMSGASWNGSMAISSGEVKLSTTDSVSGTKLNEGAIQFSNETVSSGQFTHFDPAGSGAVTGSSGVDYSGAKFSGPQIVGGQYSVSSHTPDNVLKSTSLIAVSPLGQVQSIETTNLDTAATASGAVLSKVSVDFSKAVYNARNVLDSGQITYTTNDAAGNKLATTVMSYANANPALSTMQVFKNGQLQSRIIVDYSSAQFNNDHQVVNSSKNVYAYGADGKLVSSSVVGYDAQGNKTTEQPAPATAQPQAMRALAAPAAAPPPAKLTAPTAADAMQKVTSTYRADNSLEQTTTTTMSGVKPVFAEITVYGPDGKTVVKTFSMDLTALSYDAGSNSVAGSVSMQAHTGGEVLNAASTIQF